ncbi:MAG: hypothetical protein ABEJ88_09465 [Halobacterium sp.]
MTDAKRTVLAALGVAAVAAAVGITVGVLPPSVTGPVTGFDATLATGVLGAGLVAYALHQRRRREDAGLDRLTADPDAPRARDPGAAVDDAVRRAAENPNAALTQDARRSVRARVRATAVRAYARSQSVDEDAAADAVAAGAWTDDVVAAAFLGDERAPRLPLRERLRGWIRPDRAFERRVSRAADAVHAVATEGSR